MKITKRLYICSNDYIGFDEVRQINCSQWVRIGGKSFLKGTVDLPIDLHGTELPYDRATTFYLFPRFSEQEIVFKELSVFPIFVHVFIVRIENKNPTHRSDFFNIAWSSLYDDLSEAQEYCHAR